MSLRSAGYATARCLSPLFNSRVAEGMLSNSVYFLEALQGIGTGAQFSSRQLSILFGQLTIDAPVVFDVGAHAGGFVEQALARTKPGSTVHAFEPANARFGELSKVFHQDRRVKLNRLALSSEAGSGVLFYDKPGSQLASLTPRPRYGLTLSEAVQLETLDNYCGHNSVPHIDLLNLDVEGHELEVLEGASQLLEKASIRRILFEFGGCNVDTRTFFRDIYECLTERGMKISRLTLGGLIAIDLYHESLERFRTTNYPATLVAPDVYSS